MTGKREESEQLFYVIVGPNEWGPFTEGEIAELQSTARRPYTLKAAKADD